MIQKAVGFYDVNNIAQWEKPQSSCLQKSDQPRWDLITFFCRLSIEIAFIVD